MVTEMCLPFSSIQWDWMSTERSLNSAWNPDFSEHSVSIQWTFRNVSVDWKENFHPVFIVFMLFFADKASSLVMLPSYLLDVHKLGMLTFSLLIIFFISTGKRFIIITGIYIFEFLRGWLLNNPCHA